LLTWSFDVHFALVPPSPISCKDLLALTNERTREKKLSHFVVRRSYKAVETPLNFISSPSLRSLVSLFSTGKYIFESNFLLYEMRALIYIRSFFLSASFAPKHYY
jgi:hypothetical protein